LSEATNEAVIERFYHELWNRWNLTVADEIVSEDVRFRGSTLEGRESFKGYVETVRAAFPDWHNRIDEMISCEDRVVTRMTWSGTHRGRLQDVEPTGELVEYVGAAIFRLEGGRIEEGWVVGDTQKNPQCGSGRGAGRAGEVANPLATLDHVVPQQKPRAEQPRASHLRTHTSCVAFGSIAGDALGVRRGFFNTLTPSRHFDE
jgi:predicted ester cyclase